MRYGEHRPRFAPSARNAVIEGMQRGPRRTSDVGGDFAQDRFEVGMACGGRPTLLFTSAALVAWADPRKGGKDASHSQNAAKARANLGENRRRSDGSSRGQGEQDLYGALLLGQKLGKADFHPLDGPLQLLEVIEQFTNEQAVMGWHSARQCQPECWQLLAQAPFGQLCQHLWVRLSPLDRLEHAAPAYAHHIARYCSQLAIGRLQYFVDAVDLSGALLYQRASDTGSDPAGHGLVEAG
jgi:hypothetical protein